MKVKYLDLYKPNEDGSYFGKLGPILFARGAAEKLKMKLHALVMLGFDDERVHQFEENLSAEDYKGTYTLVLIEQAENGIRMAMIVKEKEHSCPVAMWSIHKDDFAMGPHYRNRYYTVELSEEEIQTIFLEVGTLRLFVDEG